MRVTLTNEQPNPKSRQLTCEDIPQRSDAIVRLDAVDVNRWRSGQRYGSCVRRQSDHSRSTSGAAVLPRAQQVRVLVLRVFHCIQNESSNTLNRYDDDSSRFRQNGQYVTTIWANVQIHCNLVIMLNVGARRNECYNETIVILKYTFRMA